MIPTLFLVTVVVFLTVRLVPGSVIDQMLAMRGGQVMGVAMDADALRHSMGPDPPEGTMVYTYVWVDQDLKKSMGK